MNLNAITNEAVRNACGTRAMTSCGLAIHGANVENVLLASAVVHCIDGNFQTNLAADTEVDLSLSNFIDADGNAIGGPVTMPAIAAGGGSRTKVYLVACIGTAQYIIEPEVNVAAAQDNLERSLHCPNGYCPVGTIKVVQSATDAAGSAAFTLGTTNLSGVTNQTVTFGSISAVPATVADVA